MRFLNSARLPLLELPQYESLIWHEKFYGVGVFEFHYRDYIEDAAYIYNTDNGQLAIIEDYDITEDEKTIYKGRHLKALLDNKVISSTKIYTDQTPEYIVKDLVASFAGQSIVVETVQGYLPTTLITVQVTGENLLEYTDNLLQTYGLSATIDYDYVDDIMTYKVIEAQDNTMTKPPFSKKFGTLVDNSYTKVTKTFKNYAYVAGEVIEGQERVVVEVDMREGSEEKREMWVDAQDLTKTVYINSVETILTEAQYLAMLTARGVEQLLTKPVLLTVNMSAYDKFVLGEIRMLKTKYYTVTQQVTEVLTSYEDGAITQDAVFGTRAIEKAN